MGKHCDLLTELPEQTRARLLRDPAVAAFARFEPLVLDHGSPGMTQRIEDLTDEVIAAAACPHKEFRKEWQRWEQADSGATRTVRKLIRAVLVVRNNIAHGEKTPSGPDMQRRERNRAVARVILPLLDVAIDAVLDMPSRKLAAYGTLRPGRVNENVIDVDGKWFTITLTGRLWNESGLPAFEYDVAGQPIDAELFVSAQLPMVWDSLDQFEGDNYARRLGLYEENCAIGVANTYEWARRDW